MRVTVCQLPDDRDAFASAWGQLVEHVHAHASGFVVLPENIGSSWFPERPAFDRATWEEALREHDALIGCLRELGETTVVGSRPLEVEGLRLNRGFAWTAEAGVHYLHDKYYMPYEPSYFETHWFDRPPRDFSAATVRDVTLGVMICTDVMFNEWARHYGRQGAVIVAVPRTTDPHDRWRIALRMAAVASGAFALSSNRFAAPGSGKPYGGPGMVISPDGALLAATSEEQPFVTVEIDLAEAAAARGTYPRYVSE